MLVGTVHEYSVLRTQAGTERRGSRLSGQMRTGGVARLSQRLISQRTPCRWEIGRPWYSRAGTLAASPMPCTRECLPGPVCLQAPQGWFQTPPPRSLASEPERNIVPWPRFLITRSLQSFPQLLRPRTHSAPQVHPIWGVLPPTRSIFPAETWRALATRVAPERRTGPVLRGFAGQPTTSERPRQMRAAHRQPLTTNNCPAGRSGPIWTSCMHFSKWRACIEPPRRRPQCRVPRTAGWATRHPPWNLCSP
jgi:hypothetical protein